MNDDLTFLASAYLDGDVTADERARVDGDPEALAEVDRLRTVRVLLGDVEPQSISMREAHLASALDAWSRLPEAERTGARRDRTPVGIDAAAAAGAASVTAPTPLRSNRRRTRTTSTRWLTSAAAALVLVLVGGVALQLRTDSSDDSATAPADAGADESLDASSAEARTSGDQADDALAPSEAASDEVAAELDTGVGDPPPPGEGSEVDRLETTSDLADFASAAVGAPVAPDVPAATSGASGGDSSEAETFLADAEFPLCLGVDVIVGPAVYGDVPVVVGIDESQNLAIAYRAATCTEVARVRLPRAGG